MRHKFIKSYSFILLLIFIQFLTVSCSVNLIDKRNIKPTESTLGSLVISPTVPTRMPTVTIEPEKPTITATPLIADDRIGVEAFDEKLYIHHDPGVLSAIGIGEGGLQPINPEPMVEDIKQMGFPFIRFANYSDQFIFIDDRASVWLGDLQGKDRTLVTQLVGPLEDIVTEIQIEWTPDDMHFIIKFPDSWQQEKQIYHIRSGTLEKWDYQCDRLAISPKTNQVAIWCPRGSGNENVSAVLEWGEEIWYSDNTPEDPILILSSSNDYLAIDSRNPFPIVQLMGWSPTGDKIAFFDLTYGNLKIINNEGTELHEIKKAAYFLSDFYSTYKLIPPRPIQWAGKSDYLLWYGVETSQFPCPREIEILESGMHTYETSSCWSIVDSSSGKITWRLPKDFYDHYKSIVEFSGYNYLDASISSSGKQVAIAVFIPSFSTVYKIDTHNNMVELFPLYAWKVHFGK